MSYSFDGKVVNQSPKFKFNSGNSLPTCEKCSTLVTAPMKQVAAIGESFYFTYNYLGKKEFIYETKSGSAVVYCSEYCRDKHNHRFKK